jgi:sugar transferase (PEP-CTERM/EpsH1 system associated)
MRILFVTARPTYPLDSGDRIRMYHLITNLANRHKIHLISFVEDEVQRQAMNRMQNFCEMVHCVFRPGYTRMHYGQRVLKFFWGASYYVTDFQLEGMRTAIKAMMEMYRFDLAHFDFFEMGQYVDEIKNMPTVLTEHDIFYLKTQRYLKAKQPMLEKLATFREWIKLYWYEPKVWDKFDRVIVTSSHDAALLTSRRSNKKVSVIPNGVDTAYFDKEKVEQESTADVSLVYTGGLNSMANRDAVLFFSHKIYPEIKEKVPGIRWYIVGKNPTATIQALAAKDPNIIVTGKVEDVRPYIARASVYVVPLRIGSGTRLKILEAMAMKKAVISTSIGCEGLNVEHGKHILIADRPQEFVDSVIQAIHDRSLRLRLGDNGRRLVESEYDWKICAERLERIFEDTCTAYNKKKGNQSG